MEELKQENALLYLILHGLKKKDWKELQSISLIRSIREVDGKNYRIQILFVQPSWRYGIDKNCSQESLRIENSLQWVLDVVYKENGSGMRAGHFPQNMTIMRHIALNLMKKDTKSKMSLNARRKQAG